VLTLRKFHPTEMFSVIKLASETLTERYNPSLFNYFYETFPEGFIIAEKNHKIIGFLIGVRINNENAKILMLGVSKQYRNKKIGSELLKKFVGIISEINIKKIELEVRTNNRTAIKFYQNNGFKITEIQKRFYQSGENAYTMTRII
jgi:ribosomal-protein-alanine N-acetyltransferase